MTNMTRAHAALCAITAHQETKGTQPDDPEQGQDDVVDLLTDLMHYADHNKMDFEHCLEVASSHFEAEKEPQSQERGLTNPTR